MCNEFAGPSTRHYARATQLLSKKCCHNGEPLASVSDLTGLKFESHTTRSRNERVTALSVSHLSITVTYSNERQKGKTTHNFMNLLKIPVQATFVLICIRTQFTLMNKHMFFVFGHLQNNEDNIIYLDKVTFLCFIEIRIPSELLVWKIFAAHLSAG